MASRLENKKYSVRMIESDTFKKKKEEYAEIIEKLRTAVESWEEILGNDNIDINTMDILMNRIAIYRDYLASLLGYFSLVWQDEFHNEIIEQKKAGVKKPVIAHAENVASYNVPEKEYLEIRLKSLIEIINAMKKMGDHLYETYKTAGNL